MSSPGRIKDNWLGQGKTWQIVAKALNKIARWTNLFQVEPPLGKREVDGSISVYFDTTCGTAPFPHPWRLSAAMDSGTASYTIAGGTLLAGEENIEVSGMSGTVSLTDDRKWWLYVRYPNDGTTAEAEIRTDPDEFPASDYLADELPASSPCAEVTLAGWSETIIPLAALEDGNVRQYAFSDIQLPRGLTLILDRVLSHEWDGSELKHVTVVETYVNGVLTAISGPSCEVVFDTAACPDGAPVDASSGGEA